MSCGVCTLVLSRHYICDLYSGVKNLVYCHQCKDKIIIYKLGMRVSNIKY